MGREAGGTLSLEELPRALSEAICGAAFTSCCRGEERDRLFQESYADESACRERQTAARTKVLDAFVRKAIAEGTVTYGAAAGHACVERLRARGACAELVRATDGLCESAFTGTLLAGAACKSHFECASGACAPGGTCRSIAPLGDDCANATCGGDAFCESTGRCASRRIDGASCQRNAECRSRHCRKEPGATSGTCGPDSLCAGP